MQNSRLKAGASQRWRRWWAVSELLNQQMFIKGHLWARPGAAAQSRFSSPGGNCDIPLEISQDPQLLRSHQPPLPVPGPARSPAVPSLDLGLTHCVIFCLTQFPSQKAAFFLLFTAALGWIVPPNSYMETFTFRTSDCAVFGNSVLTEVASL